MRIIKLIALIISISILQNCKTNFNSSKSINEEINFDFISQNEVEKYEKNKESKDISLGYFWSVDDDIYPYFETYKFKNPKSYERPPNEAELKIDYFFTKQNQLKLKLYEWNVNYDSKKTFKSLDKKFDEIKNFVTEKLGKPSFQNYEDLENSNEETIRDDVKWNNDNLGAYLFRFKGKGGFDQIRLSIYKK